MGNLSELFISFVLATGPSAVPLQRGLAPDANTPVRESTRSFTTPFGLSSGARVRFSTAEEQPITEGDVVVADPEALLLRVRGVDEPVRIPWSSLRRLEACRGRHSLARRGAKVGALSVGIPWVAAGAFAWSLYNRWECGRNCLGWGAFAADPITWAGVAVGAGAGALIGALAKSDRWDQVDLPAMRVHLKPQRRGLALLVAWRF